MRTIDIANLLAVSAFLLSAGAASAQDVVKEGATAAGGAAGTVAGSTVGGPVGGAVGGVLGSAVGKTTGTVATAIIPGGGGKKKRQKAQEQAAEARARSDARAREAQIKALQDAQALIQAQGLALAEAQRQLRTGHVSGVLNPPHGADLRAPDLTRSHHAEGVATPDALLQPAPATGGAETWP